MPVNAHHYRHWMSTTLAHLHEQSIRFYSRCECNNWSKIKMCGKEGNRGGLQYNSSPNTSTKLTTKIKHTKGILPRTTAVTARYWCYLSNLRTFCLPPSCVCRRVVCKVITVQCAPFFAHKKDCHCVAASGITFLILNIPDLSFGVHTGSQITLIWEQGRLHVSITVSGALASLNSLSCAENFCATSGCEKSGVR